jgi:hypothetical protein
MDDSTSIGTELSTAGSEASFLGNPLPGAPTPDDLAMQSLRPSVTFRKISSNDYEFKRLEIVAMPDFKKAVAHLEELMTPAGKDMLYQALTALKLMTAGKAQDSDTVTAQIRIYAKQLERYPADAAIKGIGMCAEFYQWFPSWHELKTEVERLCPYRLAAGKALAHEMAKKLGITPQRIFESVPRPSLVVDG